MPFEIFLKLDGIQGESTARDHKDETVVLSYEQGVDCAAPSPGGGGGSTGPATFSGVRFRKPVDVGSVPLLLACASGMLIKNAIFTFHRPSMATDFYTVKLEDVVVTHIVQRAGVGKQYPLSFGELTEGTSSEGILDEATLSYLKILWEYKLTLPNGTPSPTVKGGWDLKLNKKI